MTFDVYLSPPDVGERELELLIDAFRSGWIAPLGPHVDAFERELAARVGAREVVALSSGTAALHLALHLQGVGAGDEVLVSDLTFAATANAVVYTGATPVFVDSETATWNMDPELLEAELERRARVGRLPAAIVVVDLYGQCADYDRILPLCERFEVPLVEDAAEALGATWHDGAAGTFGTCGVLSFNGNKIITTSGGGALVTDDVAAAGRARKLATQAREPAPHYEHAEVGFNYRLSNLLAAVGRGQLERLDEIVAARRARNANYRDLLRDVPGVTFMPHHPSGQPNDWLTVLTIDSNEQPHPTSRIRELLGQQGIEARPIWKPMHLQPAFADAPMIGGAVSRKLFATGLCLPSGADLTPGAVCRVTEAIRTFSAP